MKLRSFTFTLALVGAVLFAGVVWVQAGDLTPPAGPVSPTMKTLAEVEPRVAVQTLSGDGDSTYLINQSGSYYLTGNITGESGKNGIKILADNVVLDLCGFSLAGVSGSLNGVLVGIYPTIPKSVAIRNGTARGWGQNGIDAHYGINGLLEDLQANNNGYSGILVGGGSVARDCCAMYNGGVGISLSDFASDDAGITLIGCSAHNNSSDGFSSGGRCTITDCTATHNDHNGFYMVYAGCSVIGCVASLNEQDGFRIEGVGSTITNCTASVNTQDGIDIRTGGRAVGNDCYQNGTSSSSAGIRVYGTHCRIEANHVADNAYGIYVLYDGNLIIKNSAGNNSTNYSIVGGNHYGQIINSPGAGFTNNNSWANFEW
jgi:parallel beta-helix repeat protein